MILFVLVWLGCAVACAAVASSKNRDEVTWFFVGAIGGVLALIAIAAMPAVPTTVTPTEERVACPQCREMIIRGAAVCRFCGAKFEWPVDDSALTL